MKLIPLKEEHYRALFKVVQIAEPFGDPATFDEFFEAMESRTGFVVCNAEGDVIGSVTYDNYVPSVDIVLHVTVLPEFHGRWINRSILKQTFSYPFIDLDLRRLSGFSIKGVTDKGGETLERLGFQPEGNKREGVLLSDGKYHDLILYGMLREECKWLREF